jgi:deoxyribodipyrimidine photolyase-like uncharacterized protein
MKQCIGQPIQNRYSHHIQRLMVKNRQRMTPELRVEVGGRASEMLANLDSL